MDDDIYRKAQAAADYLERSFAQRQAEIRRRTLEGEDFNAPIRERAAVSWTKGGIDYWLLRFYLTDGHWCGYARFTSRPVKEPGMGGILTYVPVHSGISYCQESPDGSVYYGFDCGHVWDRSDWGKSLYVMHRDHERRMKMFSRTKDPRYLYPKPKRRRLSWLIKQAEGMAAGIRCAAQVEDAYNAATTQEERAAILDQFHHYLAVEGFGKFNLGENAGAMANLLSGRL